MAQGPRKAKVTPRQIAVPPDAQVGNLMLVGPDGNLALGEVMVVVEGTVGSGGGLEITTQPSPLTVPSGTLPGTPIGVLAAPMLTAPLTWQLLDDAGGRVVLAGNALSTGLVAFDQTEVAPRPKVQVTDATGDNSLIRTLTINVGPPSGASAPLVDFNMVADGYLGGTKEDLAVVQPDAKTAPRADGTVQAFNPNEPRVTDTGWHLTASAGAYIGRNSLNPVAWPAREFWVNGQPVDLGPVAGTPFSRVHYTNMEAYDGSNAAYTPGHLTEDLAVGDTITVVFKFEKPAEIPDADFEVAMVLQHIDAADPANVLHQRAAAIGDFALARGSGLAGIDQGWNPDGLTWTIKRCQEVVTAGFTTMEVEITYTAQWAGRWRPMLTGLGAAADDMIWWAIHVERGSSFTQFVPVAGATVAGAGDVGTLGGEAANHLLQPSGIAVFEFSGVPDPRGKALVSIGGAELIGAHDFEVIRVKGGETTARVFHGGLLGTFLVVFRWTPEWYEISVNGGELVRHNGPHGLAPGPVRIGGGTNVVLRRFRGFPLGLPDAQIPGLADLRNKTLVRAGDGLNLGPMTTRLDDDFKGDSISVRPDPNVWNDVSSAGNAQHYSADWDDPGKHWWSRYVFHKTARGHEGNQNINNEWGYFADWGHPDWVAAGAENCLLILPEGDGICRLRAVRTADQPPAVQAMIPNRWAEGEGGIKSDTGVKYPYLTAAMITAGFFRQRGGYWECRMKVPKGFALWPAFWGLTAYDNGDFWSETELDVIEQLGRYPNQVTGALHSNAYGTNRGIVKEMPWAVGDNFHTYGCKWTPGNWTANPPVPGKLEFYFSGLKTGELATTQNFDQFQQYVLLNLAVGDGGNWVGVPNAGTDAAMPADMLVDWVRISQFNSAL